MARDGFGDMAVSNAIGSNVFDINLGMGLPFLISICIRGGAPFLLVSQEMMVRKKLHIHASNKTLKVCFFSCLG